jgi:hypothetical protein
MNAFSAELDFIVISLFVLFWPSYICVSMFYMELTTCSAIFVVTVFCVSWLRAQVDIHWNVRWNFSSVLQRYTCTVKTCKLSNKHCQDRPKRKYKPKLKYQPASYRPATNEQDTRWPQTQKEDNAPENPIHERPKDLIPLRRPVSHNDCHKDLTPPSSRHSPRRQIQRRTPHLKLGRTGARPSLVGMGGRWAAT